MTEGVYDAQRGSDRIRVIVANELAEIEENSLLHLFSATQNRVEYGKQHHLMHNNDTSTLVDQVFSLYRQEGRDRPYTIEDFRRDVEPYYIEKTLNDLTTATLLSKFPPDELLSKFTTEQLEAYLKKAKRRASTTKARKKRKKS